MHADRLAAAGINVVSIFASELLPGDRFIAPDTQMLVTVRAVTEHANGFCTVDLCNRKGSYLFDAPEEVFVVHQIEE